MYNVAVIGATGNVGRQIMQVLAERNFPIKNITAVSSHRSKGKEVSFGMEKRVKAEDIDNVDFSDIQIALCSAGSEVSKKYLEDIASEGTFIIDNASFFRMDKDVPLIIPEINPEQIHNAKKKIVANPNCSAIQMLVALNPLHKLFGIKRIVVSTYQSVSGKGKLASDELYMQTKKMFEASNLKPTEFPKQIAFNCIPQVGSFETNGYTGEEIKMAEEAKKIMGTDSILVNATCVRVPVFNCHAESINVEFENEFELDQVYDALEESDSVLVMDRKDDAGYMTQVEASQTDAVYISRIRRDTTAKNALNMWVVADNLRKGAALNAVQIAELAVKEGVI